MSVRPLLVVVLLSYGARAFAASVTDVPDAADGDDPFDAHLSVGFDYTWQRALITRENTQLSERDPSNTPRTVDVRELDYQRHSFRLRPRIDVGVFHDLAVFFEWPIVLYDQQSTRFHSGTSAANSTITRDMESAPSLDGWPQTGGSGGDFPDDNGSAVYGFPAQSYNGWKMNRGDGSFESVRAGFDYPILGVRWSPLNNERDPSKPTITLQADYNLGFIPLPVSDPTNDRHTPSDPGPVARGLHEFHFHVGMSKRWLLLDPYFLVDYWLPFRATDGYPGLNPRQRGGFTLGLEVIAFENPKIAQRLTINVASWAQLHSEGRDYSEVSDLLGEVTYTGQFMRVGGNLGAHFKVFEYAYLELVGSGFYDTEHFVTAESIGQDRNDNEAVDIDPAAKERNQYFNPVLDTPGRRLKVGENLRLQLLAQVALTF